MKLSYAIAGSVLALCAATTALASNTTTGTLAVNSNVGTVCSVSATPIAFGSYTGLAIGPITSGITVVCNTADTVSIGLTSPNYASSDINAGTGFNMINGSDALPYTLYQGPTSGSTAWTDANSMTGISVPAGGSGTTTTISGYLAASLTTVPGTYSDTVTVTVTY